MCEKRIEAHLNRISTIVVGQVNSGRMDDNIASEIFGHLRIISDLVRGYEPDEDDADLMNDIEI